MGEPDLFSAVATGVIADRGASRAGMTAYHHEYIVYDRNQAYPEYVVYLSDD